MALALAEAEKFLLHEARLLDEARYDEWLALFTEDGWYWVPLEYGQKSPFDTASLIYDDRRLLETRVRRLANPSMHSQNPPSRASRIIANVTMEETASDAATVRSKFSMVEYRRNAQRFFAGTCFHRLVGSGGATRIAWKRVDLVNCEAELEGLVLPF
jgi:3-phenylpropionate/cinnamic acid dioxygenase small subunit